MAKFKNNPDSAGRKPREESGAEVFESELPDLSAKDLRFLLAYVPKTRQGISHSCRTMSIALIHRHLSAAMKEPGGMMSKETIQVVFGVLDRTDPKQAENAGPTEIIIRRADPAQNYTPER
jgi:hypothetical protein